MEERIVAIRNQTAYFKVLGKIDQETWSITKNKETVLCFLRDCELGKTTLKGQKKKIGYSRLLRCLSILRLMDKSWFKKSFEEVTEEQMDNFILGLDRDIILKSDGKPYTSETKTSIKKFIKKFYKWLLGNNEVYPRVVKFIDTSNRIPEIKPLKKEEVDLLIDSAPKMQHKFIIAFLFDAGTRIEEMLNVRMCDIKKDGDCFKVRVTISKTRPRTISLPLYTEMIEKYIKQHPDNNNPEAYLCTLNEVSIRKMLMRIGRKALKKRVYPHLFRHSSATFYANRVTHYQMCYRYGWSLSSAMPSRYIDFNGLADQEATKSIREEINTDITKENKKLKEELDIIKSNLKELQEQEQKRAEIEQKRMLEQQLHKELFDKSMNFENKEGITDIKEIMFQILKKDKTLIEKLKALSQ